MEECKRKKRGRSKIFRSCFPFFAAEEKPFSCDKSDHRRNTRNGQLGKSVLMAVSGAKGKDSIADVNFVNGGVTVTASAAGPDCYSKRCSHRGLIHRLLKSIWFDSLMVKKIQTSSSKPPIGSTRIDLLLSIQNAGKSSNNKEDSSIRCSNLLLSSSWTTSGSPSSSSDQKTSSSTDSVNFRQQLSFISTKLEKPHRMITSGSLDQNVSTGPRNTVSSNSIPVKKLNSRTLKSGRNNWNIRVCLFLLLSLFVLIVYGRIYSIICTSTWFYILPCGRVKRVNSVSTAAKWPVTESHVYKKRVIMAGLLNSARNPLR